MASANPGLVVRLAADVEELKRNLADGMAAIDGLRPSVEKMQQTWERNADKIVQDARNVTAGYQGLKDGVTLTARDAAAALKKLELGMEQLRASGQPIPPLMQQTADKLRAITLSASSAEAPTSSLVTKLQGLAGTLGIAFGGAAVVAGLKSLVQGTFNYAEQITDLSARMGVSTTAAQQWKFASEQTGSSLETVQKAVIKLSDGLASGDKSLVASLQAAGVDAAKLRAMKPEDAFNAMTAAIQTLPNPMDQARLALDAFGKSGAELLPAIRNGFADIANEAPVMSDRTIEALDRAKDNWEKLSTVVTIKTGEIVGSIMEYLERRNEFYSLYGRATPNDESKAWADMATSVEGAAAKASSELRSGWIPTLKSAEQAQREYNEQFGESERTQRLATEAGLRLAEAFQKQVDVLTGKALKREVSELAKQVESAGKQGGLTAFEYEKLGARLVKMVEQGASLDGELRRIYDRHILLNPQIKVTTDAYAGLAAILKSMPSYQLGNAPAPIDILPKASFDVYGMVAQVRSSLAMLGKNSEIALAAAPVGASLGRSVAQSFGKAMEGLGPVVVGALQGGGNVMKSVFASVGADLGADFGKSIAKSVGGTFGKTLGSFAGPLAALAGSALGSIVGKIFSGNNTKTAREQAAQMLGFGSLDGLYAALRGMGEEGARLVQQGLNVIGKNDTAANNQWIKDVEALIQRTGEAAREAGEKLRGMRDRLEELKQKSEPTWRDMQDAAQQLGVELSALGPIFQQQRLTAQATDIWNAFDTLRRGGADMNAVIAQSAAGVNAFIAESLKAGTTIPENFRSILQSLIDQGELIDENGERITDLSRFKFGEAVKSEWELIGEEIGKLTLAIEALVKQLEGPVVGAVRTVTEEFGRWDGISMPRLDVGGSGVGGYVPGGAGSSFLSGAVLSRPLSAFFAPQARQQSPIQITVVSQLDGREVARNQARYTPELLFVAGI